MKEKVMSGEVKPDLTEIERRCEEATRRYEELISNPRYVKKPVAVVTVPVSDADAEIVRSGPESVSLHARRKDGVLAVVRPARNPNHVEVMVDWVREVDACGRPVWPKGGAQHEYNPLDALKT
jgi:hypothetical protein